jgi:osmotically-inducible protein OsmY
MLEASVKRFPVLRGQQVVGVVSRHDLIKVIARTDAEVEGGVKTALIEEGVRLTSMGVHARDGVVELTGDGDSGTLRLAEILARSVPGVLDVRVIAGTG